MQLKPEEISKVIRSQIKYYDNAIHQNETGTILMVGRWYRPGQRSYQLYGWRASGI